MGRTPRASGRTGERADERAIVEGEGAPAGGASVEASASTSERASGEVADPPTPSPSGVEGPRAGDRSGDGLPPVPEASAPSGGLLGAGAGIRAARLRDARRALDRGEIRSVLDLMLSALEG